MQMPNDETKPKTRRPYERPTATRLTPDEAKVTLMGYAVRGHKGAKELLELMSSGVLKSEPTAIADARHMFGDTEAPKAR